MYFKIFLNIILVLLVSIIQLAFFSSLPSYLSAFNSVLIILIFILVLTGPDKALIWAVGSGLVLDIFSFLPFGIYMISFFLTIISINFLLVNFLTNRSLYSFLVLSIFGTIVYEMVLYTLSYFIIKASGNEFPVTFNFIFWKGELNQVILNLSGMGLFFYLFGFLSKKMKPVFLLKK